MARVTIQKRTRKRHKYFFAATDRSPMYVVQIDGKAVWAARTKREALVEANKARESIKESWRKFKHG